MTPVYGQVRHNPPHSYGDCLRACVASLLDKPSNDVPHFFHDGCDGSTGTQRMRDYLRSIGREAFYIYFDASIERDMLLQVIETQNPGVPYMLFGETASGGHVVVCQDGEVIHNPDLAQEPILGAGSDLWHVMVIVQA